MLKDIVQKKTNSKVPVRIQNLPDEAKISRTKPKSPGRTDWLLKGLKNKIQG